MKKVSEKYSSILISVVLAGTTLALYWPVHSYEFINYDDNEYVSENPQVNGGLKWESVQWAFTATTAANWHPLTWLSHMLDVELFGLDAGAHHIVNVCFHIANSVLLFLLLKYMTATLWPAAFVAAFFAFHPLHVESVAWISERKDVLSTLFAFLTMLAWVRYTKHRRLIWYIWALSLFAVSLMAKPMLVTLPFVLLLLDYWPFEWLKFSADSTVATKGLAKQAWNLIFEKIPFFALSAVSCVVTFIVQRSRGAMATTEVFSLKVRIFNTAISYIEYIKKMFWPTELAIPYPHPGSDISMVKSIICIVLLIVMTVLLLYLLRRRKYLAVGWLWYIGTLIPVIGLVQVGVQSMADRYTYSPSIGIFIIFSWGVAELSTRWKYRKPLIAAAAGIALIALIIAAMIQIFYWQNSLTLFSHTIAVTENNCIAYNNLGIAYGKLSHYQEAMESYKQAVRIKPDYAEAHYNLGIVYGRLGRYQDEIDSYRRAIRAKPNYAEAYNNLGAAYGTLGRYQEAVESYTQAVRLKPDYAEAQYNMGNAYLRLGLYYEAIEPYKQAIRINPGDTEARFNLGVVYLRTGDKGLALEQYEILKTLNFQQANQLLSLINVK